MAKKDEQTGRALVGMKEICDYARRSESTVLCWIRDMEFPAKKISGIWESNTMLVDKWKIMQIEGAA